MILRVHPLAALPNDSPLQLIQDTEPPHVVSMVLTQAPSATAPSLQLLLNFSEPVQWLVDANVPEGTSNNVSLSVAAAVNNNSSTALAPQLAKTASTRVLLTNAVLLNASIVPASAVTITGGSTTGVAARAYTLWLRALPGTSAVVEVLGAAYQDVAGNRGQEDTRIAVRGHVQLAA
jgi:hypothetical protein